MIYIIIAGYFDNFNCDLINNKINQDQQQIDTGLLDRCYGEINNVKLLNFNFSTGDNYKNCIVEYATNNDINISIFAKIAISSAITALEKYY